MFTWEFWKAALIRAVRTFAESMLAYIGNGKVIEAASTQKGVVKSNASDKKWTHWGGSPV